MGNNPSICCADNTGCERVDLLPSNSFEAQSNRGKQRFLRRVVDTLRPSKQASKFFKDKFASSNLEIKPTIGRKVANEPQDGDDDDDYDYDDNHHNRGVPRKMNSLYQDDGLVGNTDERPQDHHQASASYLPAMYAMNSGAAATSAATPSEFRSFSSMSACSELDERDTRSERVTRRTSYCSDREGVEEERQPLEPEGFVSLAVE